MTTWRRITRGLAVSWCLLTALLLLGITVGILTQAGFPLGLGWIRTTGLAGLWVTLVPADVAFAGILLLGRRRRVAGGLLVTYSAFWAAVVASGLPLVWYAKSSLCLNSLGVCITSPWLGRAAATVLLAAFVLAGARLWPGSSGREGSVRG
jgi:hypothetical protein